MWQGWLLSFHPRPPGSCTLLPQILQPCHSGIFLPLFALASQSCLLAWMVLVVQFGSLYKVIWMYVVELLLIRGWQGSAVYPSCVVSVVTHGGICAMPTPSWRISNEASLDWIICRQADLEPRSGPPPLSGATMWFLGCRALPWVSCEVDHEWCIHLHTFVRWLWDPVCVPGSGWRKSPNWTFHLELPWVLHISASLLLRLTRRSWIVSVCVVGAGIFASKMRIGSNACSPAAGVVVWAVLVVVCFGRSKICALCSSMSCHGNCLPQRCCHSSVSACCQTRRVICSAASLPLKVMVKMYWHKSCFNCHCV